MKLVDERTAEQQKSHNWLVIGTDSFMSGWGGASGGLSYAVWACEGKDLDKVESWVESRSDMKRVRVSNESNRKYRPGKACAHCHIYVVTNDHPSVRI